MKVKKHSLLLIACAVWMIAGFNVLRIGLNTYRNHLSLLNFCLSLGVFLLFWFMVFFRMAKKHTRRILSYADEKQFFLRFFDVRSFLIMAFMITFGILIRSLRLLPDRFIAVFYTGLGGALFLAGVLFGLNYFKHRPVCPAGSGLE